MLRPIKKIRKIFASLRSDRSPHEIALGAALGVFLGLTPFGMHLLLPIGMLILMRCALGMGLFTFALTKGLWFLTAPMAESVGAWMHREGSPFEPLFAWLTNSYVFFWMDFGDHLVAGSYLICTIVAVILYSLIWWFVWGYRNKFEVWIKDRQSFDKVKDRKIVKFMGWLLMGKDSRKKMEEGEGDVELESKKEKKSFFLFRIFRSAAIILIPVLFLLVGAGGVWGANAYMKTALESSLTEAAGSPVSVSSAALTPFSWSIGVQDLQIADPKNHELNMIQVGDIRLGVSLLELLAGRVHVDEAVISGFRTQVVRREDGSVNLAELDPVAPDEDTESGREFSAWLKEKGAEVDWMEWTQKFLEYLKKRGEEQAGDTPSDDPTATDDPTKPELVLHGHRRDYPPSKPMFFVRRMAIEDCVIEVEDKAQPEPTPGIKSLNAEILNLNTNRDLVEEAIAVTLGAEFSGMGDASVEMSGSLLPPAQGDRLEVKSTFSGVDLTSLKAMYEETSSVNIDNGVLQLNLGFAIENGALDAPQKFSVQQLKISKKAASQELFGLDAETSGYVIEGINAFAESSPIEMTVRLHGQVESPSIEWKADFLEYARKGLEAMGRKELQKYIDKIDGEIVKAREIADELVDETKKQVEDEASKIGQSALDALKTGDTDSVKDTVENAKETLTDPDKVKEAKEKLTDPEDLKDDVKDLKKKLPWGR